MPDIEAFRGIRYDLGHVGSLSNVVAPPYDVIESELQTELYQRHAANVVRLILNRDEPGDDKHSNRYTRAGRFLRNWQREGVLYSEADPAIYVYHQVFESSGAQHTRRGFMCRVRLERFGDGNIHPHEETHSEAKVDRLKLWTECRANLSQIFGLYPDPDNAAQELLEEAVFRRTPVEATDHLGVVHRLWPVTDVGIISKAIAAMAPRPVYIADGHHRYETACDYRDEFARVQGELPPDHPANFVLMMCVSMSDPGMLVLPTHRLFRGLPPITSAQLVGKLGDLFSTRVIDRTAKDAAQIWHILDHERDHGQLAFFASQDAKWVIARITRTGRQRLKFVANDRSDHWRGLGAAILHRLVIETVLDAG